MDQKDVGIDKIISLYLDIRGPGSSERAWALCPFHQEKTPSFCINIKEGYFYCFGCGEHGTGINFIEKIEKVNKHEAKQILRQKLGIGYPIGIKNENEDFSKNTLNHIMDSAKQLYFYNLISTDNQNHHKSALEFLKRRGVDSSLIDAFAIGLTFTCYSKQKRLVNFLLEQKYTKKEIIDSKLVVRKKTGEKRWAFLDSFVDRLAFPIHDKEGKSCIGFIFRKWEDESNSLKHYKSIEIRLKEPGSYILSPPTEIFKKSEVLFNLDKCWSVLKEAPIKTRIIWITEGVFDVLALWRAGIKNAVALLGSSLSNNQLRLIQEITKKVIIFLDSDEIGRKKTLEIGLKFVQQGEIKCQVILFQDKDPAKELENFFGGYPKKEEQKRLFENKIIKLSFLDFIVHEAKNLSIKLQTKNDIETKKKILFFFAKYFSAIKNKVDKFYLISKAAELTKLPVSITAAVLRQKSHLNPFFFTTVDSLTATETDLDLDLRYLKIQKIILNKFYAQSRDKQNDVEWKDFISNRISEIENAIEFLLFIKKEKKIR